jgi:hypothetical protein
MIVVVNKNKTAQTVPLKVDYKALGVPAGAVIKDVRTGKTLKAQDLEKLQIKGYNFSLLQIGE